MQLMVFTTAMAFAMMLATILAGIGAGSLLASAWLRRFGAGGVLPVTALAAGGATYLAYMSIDPSALSRLQAREDVLTLALSALLMLPTSLASGVLFTLTGAALREQVPNDTRAAGRLTLANTVGAAAGAPVTGLLLLPFLGAERSLFSLALVYAVIAWCLLPWRADRGRLILVPATVMFALLAAAFPFGLLQGRLLKQALQPYVGPESGVLTVKESPTEFAALIRETWAGAPLQDRLITNHHSMTGTGFSARRYMKLFAYWPLAMRPEARSALLISYGVGNTGEALTRAPWLERIDVVDISRGIADLSPFVHRPGWGDPLADPRVRLRIEDGRFHLLAGSERYDIMTAEPPPPSAAGVVNLFTSEYFALVRRRLAPGGIATHWLPVHLLSVSDSRAITRAFCDIFADCSLWAGAGDDWMLVGSTGLRRPAANDLGRLWREPRTAQDLAEIGVEGPAQLAATFLADAPTLYRWYQGALPLTDDQPGRLSQRRPAVEDRSSLRQLAQGASAASFSTSAAMHQLWPPDALAGIERAFADELILDRYYHDPERPGAARELWDVLANSRQRTLPLVMLGSDPRVAALARERAVAGDQHPALSYHLGAIALSERNYTAAAALLSRADAPSGVSYPPLLLEAIALGLVGRVDEARAALHRFPANGLVEHAQTWKADVLALLDMERPKTAKTRAVDLRH